MINLLREEIHRNFPSNGEWYHNKYELECSPAVKDALYRSFFDSSTGPSILVNNGEKEKWHNETSTGATRYQIPGIGYVILKEGLHQGYKITKINQVDSIVSQVDLRSSSPISAINGLLPHEYVAPSFKSELEGLVNKYSMENHSNTPDFILAGYMWDCLIAFDAAVLKRDEFNKVNHEKSNNQESE